MMDSLSARLAALSPEKRALLERRLRKEEPAPADRITPRGVEGARPPLSFAQQRLWFFEQLEPGHSFYNLPMTTRLTGPISVPSLERAINEIVRRQESLRTTFVLEAGEPVQRIAPELHVPLETIDLESIPAAQREAEAARLAGEEASRPFDLARGPLIRSILLRLAPTDHLLVLTTHHIISDGWSMNVLQRELNALYSAFLGDQPSPLPELPTQYADFAVWQRKHISGDTLASLLAYWKKKLDGMPGLFDLPTDHPRPRIQNFRGGAWATPYPREPLAAMKAVARERESTLFMALLATFKILLHRFSGITDMVVGAPVANRNRSELEGLIGFFVNTLVLRTDLSGDPTFSEVLARVRETTLDAFAHQELPFERLVEELQPVRNLSHNPLFQVMFGLQNIAGPLPVNNAPPQFAFGTSKFDLTLGAIETQDGLYATFEFNTELFEPATIVALAEAYGTLLAAAAAEPDRRISELPLVTPERRRALLAAAATRGTAPTASRIHELFEAQVARIPSAVAAEFQGERLTYAELDARANQLARALRARGAGHDVRIGLCMERSLELVIGMLGVLKCGAAFVPLDPTYPPDRLAFMLDDTHAPILLTSSRLRSVLPDFAGERIALDSQWESIAEHSAAPFDGNVSPDDLAYVIYTSGSTGRPKGVMVPHRCACNAAQAQIDAFALARETRVLQFGSLSFDISIFDLLMSIGCGGTLVLAPQEDILPGPPLAETLRALRIEAITIPPSALAVVPTIELPRLQTLVCGGEALSAELAAQWMEGRRLFNAYGPTETTIWATVARCSGGAAAPPIGRAISNTQAYVLDARMQPVPAGFPGELYLGGAGVARGYQGRPDLTAERNVPDPFSETPGARLYRTGDRVKLLPSGEIQFLGRVDQQIKLRGYRIELGEIEAALLAHARVREAAAVTQRSQAGEMRIAAFCVATDGEPIDRGELFAHLRKRLPEFMVPASLRIVPSLPLNGSGKLDRAQLSTWTEGASEGKPNREEPRTATEETVATVYRDILEVEHVGAHDSFFELGGHSLLATRAVTRLNQIFRIALPLRALFEHPTVAQLAKAIEEEQAAGPRNVPPEITRIARHAVTAPADTSR